MNVSWGAHAADKCSCCLSPAGRGQLILFATYNSRRYLVIAGIGSDSTDSDGGDAWTRMRRQAKLIDASTAPLGELRYVDPLATPHRRRVLPYYQAAEQQADGLYNYDWDSPGRKLQAGLQLEDDELRAAGGWEGRRGNGEVFKPEHRYLEYGRLYGQRRLQKREQREQRRLDREQQQQHRRAAEEEERTLRSPSPAGSPDVIMRWDLLGAATAAGPPNGPGPAAGAAGGGSAVANGRRVGGSMSDVGPEEQRATSLRGADPAAAGLAAGRSTGLASGQRMGGGIDGGRLEGPAAGVSGRERVSTAGNGYGGAGAVGTGGGSRMPWPSPARALVGVSVGAGGRTGDAWPIQQRSPAGSAGMGTALGAALPSSGTGGGRPRQLFGGATLAAAAATTARATPSGGLGPVPLHSPSGSSSGTGGGAGASGSGQQHPLFRDAAAAGAAAGTARATQHGRGGIGSRAGGSGPVRQRSPDGGSPGKGPAILDASRTGGGPGRQHPLYSGTGATVGGSAGTSGGGGPGRPATAAGMRDDLGTVLENAYADFVDDGDDERAAGDMVGRAALAAGPGRRAGGSRGDAGGDAGASDVGDASGVARVPAGTIFHARGETAVPGFGRLVNLYEANLVGGQQWTSPFPSGYTAATLPQLAAAARGVQDGSAPSSAQAQEGLLWQVGPGEQDLDGQIVGVRRLQRLQCCLLIAGMLQYLPLSVPVTLVSLAQLTAMAGGPPAAAAAAPPAAVATHVVVARAPVAGGAPAEGLVAAADGMPAGPAAAAAAMAAAVPQVPAAGEVAVEGAAVAAAPAAVAVAAAPVPPVGAGAGGRGNVAAGDPGGAGVGGPAAAAAAALPQRQPAAADSLPEEYGEPPKSKAGQPPDNSAVPFYQGLVGVVTATFDCYMRHLRAAAEMANEPVPVDMYQEGKTNMCNVPVSCSHSVDTSLLCNGSLCSMAA